MIGNSTNSTIHVGNNDIDLTGVPSVKEWKLSKSGLVIIPNVVEETEKKVEAELANNSKNAQEIEPRKVLIDKGPFEKEPIEVTIRGNGVIEFPENFHKDSILDRSLGRLFKDIDYNRWNEKHGGENWFPGDIFHIFLGNIKKIHFGNYLRDENGEVIDGKSVRVSARGGVKLCEKNILKPAKLIDGMVFWFLVFCKTGKKFDKYDFPTINKYLSRSDKSIKDEEIEQTIRDLEEVEKIFGVELFDLDKKTKEKKGIYMHAVIYKDRYLKDEGALFGGFGDCPSNTHFGSGLVLKFYEGNSPLYTAVRSSGKYGEE